MLLPTSDFAALRAIILFPFAGCVVAYRVDGLEGVAHTTEPLDPQDVALDDWPGHFVSVSATRGASPGADDGQSRDMGVSVRHLLPIIVVRPPTLSGLSLRRTTILSVSACPSDVSLVATVSAELGVAVCSLRGPGGVLMRTRPRAPTFCCAAFLSYGISLWAGTTGGMLDLVTVGRTPSAAFGRHVTDAELSAVSSVSSLPALSGVPRSGIAPGLSLVTCSDGSAVVLPDVPSSSWAELTNPKRREQHKASFTAMERKSQGVASGVEGDEDELRNGYKDGLGALPRLVLSAPSSPLGPFLLGHPPSDDEFSPGILWTRPATCSATSNVAEPGGPKIVPDLAAMAVGYGDRTMTVWFVETGVL